LRGFTRARCAALCGELHSAGSTGAVFLRLSARHVACCILGRMGLQSVMSALACAGHLALALVLWLRRDRTNIATPLSLLFLDTFVWTFAELAYSLTGGIEWHWLDHVFSSFLPVLLVQVVAGFVGRSKALSPVLGTLYVVSGGVALLAGSGFWWWRLLLGYGVASASFSVVLLAEHRARTSDEVERKRTGLLLGTLVFGTALATTDLWVDSVPALPRLSNVGMLLALVLVAACVLRLRLLGREVPAVLLAYSLMGSGLVVFAGWWCVRALPSRGALLAFALLAVVAVALGLAREVSRERAAAAARVEKLLLLGRFSEQLAHDLRNPLAALKGAVQFLIEERAQGRSLDEQTPFLSLMLEQVARTSSVVESYQRLANVEPLKAPTSLNTLVEGVLELQRFAAYPQITVNARLEPELPACDLDANLLQTTLENLLRNAREAMPNGGAITVETRSMVGSGGAPGVALSVKDDGQGMDARVLERAREQFFTTKAAGSGLGLSFAERVARAHQGRLELSSELGCGTTVQIWMPLHASC